MPPSPVQITNEQRDAAIANGGDATNAFAAGIIDEASAQVSPPLSGYDDFTTAIKNAITDGCKQFFAISSRYWQPIGASGFTVSPSFSITSDTQVGTLTLTTFTTRKVMIQLNLSAYTDVANTGAGFYVKINGSSGGIQPLQYFYNTAFDHRSMGGSWVVTIPAAGAVTITAWVGRASGTGSIILDANDIVSLSVIG